MADAKKWTWPRLQQHDVIHAARTTVTAVVSLGIAHLFKLPEAYWAAITTMIVMQSNLGAALTISEQRFAGTALGTVMGALLAGYLGSNVVWFAVGVFVLGIICPALGLDHAAYRFAGITLAIVMLVSRDSPVWVLALHRFEEVSLGIAIGLLLTAIWPGDDPAP
jgi:uncharacterized membrane protein YccC